MRGRVQLAILRTGVLITNMGSYVAPFMPLFALTKSMRPLFFVFKSQCGGPCLLGRAHEINLCRRHLASTGDFMGRRRHRRGTRIAPAMAKHVVLRQIERIIIAKGQRQNREKKRFAGNGDKNNKDDGGKKPSKNVWFVLCCNVCGVGRCRCRPL